MTKQELRNEIKENQKVFLQNSVNRIYTSYELAKKVCSSEEFEKANFVFAFMPLSDEVNIGGIILEAFIQNKKVAVPKITGDGLMEFHWISPEIPMEKGPYNIYEPKDYSDITHSKTLVNMDFVQTNALLLIPGLSFSEDGKRLGRGKGFYDRFLAEYGNRFYKLGICFDFQIRPDIPVSEKDISVDKVIY